MQLHTEVPPQGAGVVELVGSPVVVVVDDVGAPVVVEDVGPLVVVEVEVEVVVDGGGHVVAGFST
jgi:hypothetical protein